MFDPSGIGAIATDYIGGEVELVRDEPGPAISGVRATKKIRVSWRSTAPPGRPRQVYVNRRLSWSGFGDSCEIDVPVNDPRPQSIPAFDVQVGIVEPDEAEVDFSPFLAD